MATLSVRNVGPIREADLEIKKYTVFIGPQGSGKSTLAKLIAILSPRNRKKFNQKIFNDYSIADYITNDSTAAFVENMFRSKIENTQINYTDAAENSPLSSSLDTPAKPSAPSNQEITLIEAWEKLRKDALNRGVESSNVVKEFISQVIETNQQGHLFPEIEEPYIPTERNVFSMLSDAVWSLLNNDVNLPQFIKLFGRLFEQSRNSQSQLHIPFLNIRYSRENGRDLVYYEPDKAIPLSQSASGHQAIIPVLLVVEQQRRNAQRRFIIEEPELNLYPTTQKDLIYNLVSGLDPNANYHDAEWVFTTHSPYILSSLNTLLLAYKVAHQNDDLRAEVEKIIPARHWINPDDFAAYYVDEGTVRSIIQKDAGLVNGLIDDNELDDVSGLLADEQNQLLDLYRNTVNS